MAFNWEPILNTTYYALIPAVVLFAIGWYFGAANVIGAEHVNAINRYTLFLSIPVVIFKSLFVMIYYLILIRTLVL
jgi:uncharacterized membrane protein